MNAETVEMYTGPAIDVDPLEGVEIRDKWDDLRTLEELREFYGGLALEPFQGEEGVMYWKVVKIIERADVGEGFLPSAKREKEGKAGVQYVKYPLSQIEAAATIVVRLLHNGEPVAGVKVAWWWPDVADASNSEDSGNGYGIAVPMITNGDGEAAGIMGSGAYYFPPDGGPHAIWVWGVPTDLLRGLGMLGVTNHAHLDFKMELVQYGGDPEPDPDPDPIPDPIREEIRAHAEAARVGSVEVSARLGAILALLDED